MEKFTFKINDLEKWETGFPSKKDKKIPYILTPELDAAVRTALALRQPLLLTGKPGTGKTKLAEKVAEFLSDQTPGKFVSEPIKFNTKTTSTAKDLLYSYDALGHFHASGIDILNFIQPTALGKAILLSQTDGKERGAFAGRLQDYSAPMSSVVLIDEIDKAPRDFPNDLLNELENFKFSIPELKDGKEYELNPQSRVVVILTSNSEKNLPEAFLRRCVYFHIDDHDENTLKKILEAHFTDRINTASEILIPYFIKIKDALNQKKSGTAEFLSWVKILHLDNLIQKLVEAKSYNGLSPTDQKQFDRSLFVLVKSENDLGPAMDALKK